MATPYLPLPKQGFLLLTRLLPCHTPNPHNNILSNQYTAKRRSLPVARPLPLQRRALPSPAPPFALPQHPTRIIPSSQTNLPPNAARCLWRGHCPCNAGLPSSTKNTPAPAAPMKQTRAPCSPHTQHNLTRPATLNPFCPSSPLRPQLATLSQTKRRAPLNAPLFPKPATCRLFIQPAALQSPPRRLQPPADVPTPPWPLLLSSAQSRDRSAPQLS